MKLLFFILAWLCNKPADYITKCKMNRHTHTYVGIRIIINYVAS